VIRPAVSELLGEDLQNFWCVLAALWGAALSWRNKFPFQSLSRSLETSCCFSSSRSAT
jgi:hypothetical protein